MFLAMKTIHKSVIIFSCLLTALSCAGCGGGWKKARRDSVFIDAIKAQTEASQAQLEQTKAQTEALNRIAKAVENFPGH